MIRFPSIDQFRNAIHTVKSRATYVGRDENGDPIYDLTKELPKLTFRGYPKLHGTNAAAVYDYGQGTITYQSREREIVPGNDNAGFAAYMEQHRDVVHDIAEQVFEILGTSVYPTKVAIYGEWCGQGIMKGVAINELPKMFVVFAVKVVFPSPVISSTYVTHHDQDQDIYSIWIDPSEFDIHYEDARIFNIQSFWTPPVDLEIDFKYPEIAQNELIKITEEVERECPVGKHFFGKFNEFIVNEDTIDLLPPSMKLKCKEILKTEREIVLII